MDMFFFFFSYFVAKFDNSKFSPIHSGRGPEPKLPAATSGPLPELMGLNLLLSDLATKYATKTKKYP